MTSDAKEGRWDYVEGDDEPQTSYGYSPDEISRAKLRMKAEKDKLDKEEQLFNEPDWYADWQKGEEQTEDELVIDNDEDLYALHKALTDKPIEADEDVSVSGPPTGDTIPANSLLDKELYHDTVPVEEPEGEEVKATERIDKDLALDLAMIGNPEYPPSWRNKDALTALGLIDNYGQLTPAGAQVVADYHATEPSGSNFLEERPDIVDDFSIGTYDYFQEAFKEEEHPRDEGGQFTSSGGAGKKEDKPKEKKFTLAQYNRNEGRNAHGANALNLVKQYGTPEEVKEIEAINKRHKERGSISGDDYQKRYEISQKYYDNLVEDSKKPKEQKQEKPKKERKLIKSRTGNWYLDLPLEPQHRQNLINRAKDGYDLLDNEKDKERVKKKIDNINNLSDEEVSKLDMWIGGRPKDDYKIMKKREQEKDAPMKKEWDKMDKNARMLYAVPRNVGNLREDEIKQVEDLANTDYSDLPSFVKDTFTTNFNYYDKKGDDLIDNIVKAGKSHFKEAKESQWNVHTITHGVIPVTLGQQADEKDAINAVGRMYFDDGFIDTRDILSAVKVGEGRVSSDTYYYDYSEYWKKGDTYVRSGLALQAGIPTSWADTEWDDLPADVQAKIAEAGFVTSYESYEGMKWDLLPRSAKQKLSEGFTKISEADWDTASIPERKEMLEDAGFDEFQDYNASQSEDNLHPMIKYKLGQEETDEEIPLLAQLLQNELDEEEQGEDESEDIAIASTLLLDELAEEHISDYWWWDHVNWESGFDQDFLNCKYCGRDLYYDADLKYGNFSDQALNDVVPEHLELHNIGESQASEDFVEQEHPRDDSGQFTSKGGNGGKHAKTSTKDLIKQIKGGSKDWKDWGRTSANDELYAEIERRNKEIPKPTSKPGGKVFRDDPDAVKKMEQKVKYWEDQKDYWNKITKFPSRDYHTPNQLGDMKWFMGSNISANLRDAKKKLEGIKAQQERGTTLKRNPTYKGGKKRFYYTEEPPEEWQKGQESYAKEQEFKTTCVDGKPHVPETGSVIDTCVKCGQTVTMTGEGSGYWFTDEDAKNWDRIYNESYAKEDTAVDYIRDSWDYGNRFTKMDNLEQLGFDPALAEKRFDDLPFDVKQKIGGRPTGGDWYIKESKANEFDPDKDWWGEPEDASSHLLELQGLTCPNCGKRFEYPEESEAFYNHIDTAHEVKKKIGEQSPLSYYQFTEPVDMPTGKDIMDQTYGVSEPESDGQDLTGITVNAKEEEEKSRLDFSRLTDEELDSLLASKPEDPYYKGESIIEKKPPKIKYHYYKQYPYGRVQKGFFGENAIRELWELAQDSGISYSYNREELYRYLRSLGYYDEDIDQMFKEYYGESYSKEVNKDWWDNASYEERSKELTDIGFAMSADIGKAGNPLAERKWEDLPREARSMWGYYGEAKANEQVSIDTMNKARVWWDNMYPERPWADMRIGDRQRAILAFLRDPTTSLEAHEDVRQAINIILEDNMSISPEELKGRLAVWGYSSQQIEEGVNEYFANEGGVGSGRKPKYASQTRPDKGHIGWKNYGIDELIDKAEKEYKEKQEAKEQLEDPTPWASIGKMALDTAKDIMFPSEEQEAPTPSPPINGNGGEIPTDGEDEEETKPRGIVYGAYRKCPAGQVYKDGKCVDNESYNPTDAELGFVECPECNKMFYEQNLKDHMELDHPDRVNDYSWNLQGNIYDPNEAYESFNCPICDKEYENKDQMWNHFAGHKATEVKSFGSETLWARCNVCNATMTLENMHQHEHDDYNIFSQEGGKGSGKKGHKQWHLAVEEDIDYDYCPNCQAITEKINNKCQMCGKRV